MQDASDKPGATDEIEQDIERVQNLLETIKEQALALAGRLQDQLSSGEALYQIGAILIAGALGWLLSRSLRRTFLKVADEDNSVEAPQPDDTASARVFTAAAGLGAPVIAVIILWIAVNLYSASGLGVSLMRITASLLNAWIVIRLFSSFIRDPFLSRMIAALAWFAAALNVLRLLGPFVDFLDSLVVPFSARNISVFDVLSAVGLALVLLWGAALSSRFIQTKLSQSEKLTPSVRGLLGQLVRIVFIVGAIMLALGAAKVDLTGLTVLTGAIGVGIGFGLQSIFSNFIAGIIILLEKTLKVGDFVDLESGITGEVKEINVRSTLVTTNDNVDILVPNAEFITNRVTNWTLREVYRRVHVPFGVAYGTDKDLVKTAALEAAASVPFTLMNNTKRAPQVWLTEFGDSSLNFELVVWLTDDAVRRPGAVNAAYNWELETALGKHGIAIPFPQRDLHIIPPKDQQPNNGNKTRLPQSI
ncbi:MAG: hypothetical protein DHS20C05_17510 [Hyphococcus sp.]|nr:MAG: hypothetical protein DHS20C05_17510 [Marinicaulis sp.]